jgi:AcrR family transcriptional regulator
MARSHTKNSHPRNPHTGKSRARKESYHHGDLRQALIQGAIALISEKDVGSVSLREVARQVGVSHAAPYRHFADKEAMLAAVAEEGFRGLRDAMQAQVDAHPDQPLQQFNATGQAYVDWGLDHPAHYQVMFGGTQGNPATYPTLYETAGQAFQVLVDAIVRSQLAGKIQPGDPKQMANVAWAMVHGVVMLILAGQLSPRRAAELSEFGRRSLLYGLAQQSSPE